MQFWRGTGETPGVRIDFMEILLYEVGVSSGVSSAATVGVRHEAAPQSSRIGLSVTSKQMISFHRPDLP